MEQASDVSAEREEVRLSRRGFEIAKTAAIALAIAMVPRVVICEPFTIPSASMEPTLLIGDYLVVSKYAYGWSRHSVPFSPPLGEGRIFAKTPKRGDIVVFKEPRNGKVDIIKRLVVPGPGDRMQVVGGVLQITGKPVKHELLSTWWRPATDGGEDAGRVRQGNAAPAAGPSRPAALGRRAGGAITGVYAGSGPAAVS